jgi:hypothetical protein
MSPALARKGTSDDSKPRRYPANVPAAQHRGALGIGTSTPPRVGMDGSRMSLSSIAAIPTSNPSFILRDSLPGDRGPDTGEIYSGESSFIVLCARQQLRPHQGRKFAGTSEGNGLRLLVQSMPVKRRPYTAFRCITPSISRLPVLAGRCDQVTVLQNFPHCSVSVF